MRTRDIRCTCFLFQTSIRRRVCKADSVCSELVSFVIAQCKHSPGHVQVNTSHKHKPSLRPSLSLEGWPTVFLITPSISSGVNQVNNCEYSVRSVTAPRKKKQFKAHTPVQNGPTPPTFFTKGSSVCLCNNTKNSWIFIEPLPLASTVLSAFYVVFSLILITTLWDMDIIFIILQRRN